MATSPYDEYTKINQLENQYRNIIKSLQSISKAINSNNNSEKSLSPISDASQPISKNSSSSKNVKVQARKRKSPKKILSRSKIIQPYLIRKRKTPRNVIKRFGFGTVLKIENNSKRNIFSKKLKSKDSLEKALMSRENIKRSSTKYMAMKKKILSFQKAPGACSFDPQTLLTYLKKQPVPFVACQSRAQSFNLKISIQQALPLSRKTTSKARKPPAYSTYSVESEEWFTASESMSQLEERDYRSWNRANKMWQMKRSSKMATGRPKFQPFSPPILTAAKSNYV